MTAVEVLESRLTSAEGEKIYPYDDATALRVRAPKGHISWGRGFNLDACGSSGLFAVMERYLLTQLDTQLQHYPWYAIDATRASVLLEIAYNSGLSGLLHFPAMLSAVSRQDWASAAAECKVTNPELAGRYEKLARLLLVGGVT
jgi:hypothetical protein